MQLLYDLQLGVRVPAALLLVLVESTWVVEAILAELVRSWWLRFGYVGDVRLALGVERFADICVQCEDLKHICCSIAHLLVHFSIDVGDVVAKL